MVFFGRSAEREMLCALLAKAGEGFSGALVLRGEAGVGKTALLDEAMTGARAGGFQTARLTGVEPEAQLGYAGLHQFLLPFADNLDLLPAPSETRCGGRWDSSTERPRTGSWSGWAF